MMIRPRIVLADDHSLPLEAFSRLLEPECDIVGIATDGRSLIAMAPALKPDVVVLDVNMPVLNGVEAGRQLKSLLPRIKLVFLTASEDPDLCMHVLRNGASGYLLKSSLGSELVAAIRSACRGDSYVTPRMADTMNEAFLRHGKKAGLPRLLTPRQREVLRLLVEGYSMKQAAAELGLTLRTVAFHKYRIMYDQH
jgi:DNA-binding NarL/FixJ family response regulator